MGEKGQSLVEFSISLVVILLLLAGAVEFGIGLFQYIQIKDAAQEGAVYGSICQDADKIELRTRHASRSPLDLTKSDVQVTIEFMDDENSLTTVTEPGGAVKVTVSYVHKMFMPFFAGREINLTAPVTNTLLADGRCQ